MTNPTNQTNQTNQIPYEDVEPFLQNLADQVDAANKIVGVLLDCDMEVIANLNPNLLIYLMVYVTAEMKTGTVIRNLKRKYNFPTKEKDRK